MRSEPIPSRTGVKAAPHSVDTSPRQKTPCQHIPNSSEDSLRTILLLALQHGNSCKRAIREFQLGTDFNDSDQLSIAQAAVCNDLDPVESALDIKELLKFSLQSSGSRKVENSIYDG